MRAAKFLMATTAVALCGTAAHADLVISGSATQNVTCASGVCTATAANAVLNVSDLANMLGGGDVTVKTAAGAKDVEVQAPLSWASTSRLTLDAQRSVIIKKAMSVTGSGALTVATNDGGKNGELVIVPEHGSAQFWDLSSSLIIDGQGFTLVGDVKTLATDIAANPSGFYALAKPYDASVDGTYSSAPIPTEFTGTFEGLGNTISQLKMVFSTTSNAAGLFFFVRSTGILRNFGLTGVAVTGGGNSSLGTLAGLNDGQIVRDWATGSLSQGQSGQQSAGGLVGASDGVVGDSFAKMNIRVLSPTLSRGGGLIGYNRGEVTSAYADGSIVFQQGRTVDFGGLIGRNEGTVEDCFATNSIRDVKHNFEPVVGGLVGRNTAGGRIKSSYAAGLVTEHGDTEAQVGGLIGHDTTKTGHVMTSYWDLDMGIGDPTRGAGNKKNDPGITGLTTQQLQSGLPAGFDSAIWAEKENINGGFPYLKALPPK